MRLIRDVCISSWLALIYLLNFVRARSSELNSASSQTIAEIQWCKSTSCGTLTDKIFDGRYQIGTITKPNFDSTKEAVKNILVDYNYADCTNQSKTLFLNNLTKTEFSKKLYEIYYELRAPCAYEKHLLGALLTNYSYHDGRKKYNMKQGFPQFPSYDLLKAVLLKHDYPHLQFKDEAKQQRKRLYWLEFGVNKAYSVNITSIIMNQILKQSIDVYGFDSFYGLPENWLNNMPKGAFNANGQVPPVRKGIFIQKGLFNETLPGFLADPKTSCSNKGSSNILVGVNIDNDLYTGALYILNNLVPCMVEGTLLHFHEIFKPAKYHSDGKLIHFVIMDEMAALYDFLQNKGRGMILQILPYKNTFGASAVFRVIKTSQLL